MPPDRIERIRSRPPSASTASTASHRSVLESHSAGVWVTVCDTRSRQARRVAIRQGPLRLPDRDGGPHGIPDHGWPRALPGRDAGRGEDRGSFLIPVHAIFRVRLQGDRLELSALSYDWFFDRLRASRPVPGLDVVQDQKENALIVSPTARVRAWLRGQPAGGPAFGAAATFTRSKDRKED